MPRYYKIPYAETQYQNRNIEILKIPDKELSCHVLKMNCVVTGWVYSQVTAFTFLLAKHLSRLIMIHTFLLVAIQSLHLVIPRIMVLSIP